MLIKCGNCNEEFDTNDLPKTVQEMSVGNPSIFYKHKCAKSFGVCHPIICFHCNKKITDKHNAVKLGNIYLCGFVCLIRFIELAGKSHDSR